MSTAELLTTLITMLVSAAATRMLTGHWMPVHSDHVEVDYRSFTMGGIPIEEIYDPATAVRHPYPLSEPCDMPLFVNAPQFEPEPWRRHYLAMSASWRIGAPLATPDPKWFINPS